MLDERYERINQLARINHAQSYLEVGVSAGKTFSKVQIEKKVAVDPKFKFDQSKYDSTKVFFYEMESDRFFVEFASKHGPFDLIFLDGLHTFEQTFRDFCFSLNFSHKRTIWLIDDTLPNNWVEAQPNTKMVGGVRTIFKTGGTLWMGDVYKTIFAIHDFFPQFSYASFTGHTQTVLWLETRDQFKPTWNSLKKISGIGFNQFLKWKDSHLNLGDPQTVIEKVSRSFSE